MKSLAELQAVKDQVKGSLAIRENGESQTRVLVGMATCGIAAGAMPVLMAFVEEAAREGLTDLVITQTGCMGLCSYEPTVEVATPDGKKTVYGNMTPEKAVRVVKEHLIGGQAVVEYAIGAK